MPTQFDAIADRYHADTRRNDELDRVGARINAIIPGKVVLDIGNGGVFGYDPRLATRAIALDPSAAMLSKITIPSVETIVGDASKIDQFIQDGELDVVVCHVVLHHISGRDVGDTFRIRNELLATIRQKLCPGGQLVVVESLLKPAYVLPQRLLYAATRWVLARSEIPMIFFYSKKELADAVCRAFSPHVSEMLIATKKLSR